ncbi:MAG: hypothetical protein ACYC5A_09520 [Thermoleophilia bacterium]
MASTAGDNPGPRRRHASAGMLLAVALLLLAGLAGVGCADEPEPGTGTNTYTDNPSVARLRVMAVDQGLTRQAQAGSLDLAALPAGRLSFTQRQVVDGVETEVPWVVASDFFFTQIDVYYAEMAPAGDGTYSVLYQLNDEQGRENSIKLQQMTAAMAAATTATGERAGLAVIYNEAVRAIVPLNEPIVNGQIRIDGLTEAEAVELTAKFADRAYFFPDEGQESRVQR